MHKIPILILSLTAAQAQTITLERTLCFGSCPVYTLRIDASGTVSYHGEQYVAAVGDRTGKIDKAKFQDLLRQFEKVGFFQLRDEYTEAVTDLPTKFIGLTRNGKTKRILDYYGAPPELTKLEQSVDKAANVHQWRHDAKNPNSLNSLPAFPNYAEALTNAMVVWSDGALAENGWTPLMVAAVTNHADNVIQLLKSRANVNQEDIHGDTALIGAAAVRSGDLSEAPAIVRLLLANGARATHANNLGETAVMWAAYQGNADALLLLLQAGARRTTLDKAGHDALYYLNRARTSRITDPELVRRYASAAAMLQSR